VTQSVRVALGARTYDILIGEGLLAEAGRRIAALRPGARCAIVTDETVERLHGEALRAALDGAGVGHTTIAVAPGETSKSFAVYERVVRAILAERLGRNDLVIAFGGGVVGDLAGFAAATARRGMDFVQIPTTLLAQVDSSVGGKTGINAPEGKNLVGAFHQPVLVLADIAILRTLPVREFRAGYAEVVKYGLIDRPGFFDWLDANRGDIFAFGPALAQAIATSCAAKAEVVAADETETGRRALLNLGHTFGHALEGAIGYDAGRLVHGEAVAIGMAMAHEFSNRMNLCPVADAEKVRRHLAECGLPVAATQIPGARLDAAALMEFVAQDKKAKRGRLTFILTRGIGRAYIADDVPPEAVRGYLEDKTRP
jgi:3-dehydroquinate synthase